MKKYLLPKEGKFFKANLHTHTNISDGAQTPYKVKEVYKKLGYSVVAFTDHDIFLDSQYLTDSDFVALNGIEYSSPLEIGDKSPKSRKMCHFCAIAKDKTNLLQPCFHRTKYFNSSTAKEYIEMIKYDESIPDFEREYSADCINEMMKKCKEAGFFVTYNHPGGSLERYPDYMQYKYMDAIEIYNGCSIMSGQTDYNPREYEDFVMTGRRLFCVGGDDSHLKYMDSPVHTDAGRAFTMIKAKELTYESIIHSLTKGHFYASEGPEIYELYYEDGKIHIKTSDCDRITLSMCGRKNRSVKDEGNGLNQATFDVMEDDIYVRFTIADKYRMTASTRAFFVEDLVK